MKYIIEHGNIVNYDTDAVVLPANKLLKEGSGTSRAIFSAAGKKQLSSACNEIGKCEVGMAVPTPGYKLQANYIIHAVVPKWIDGNHGEYDLLSSAYLSALSVADVMQCKSIAFPLLSAGNNGFDKTLALEIARNSIDSFDGKNIETVKIVILKEEMVVRIKSMGFEVFESNYNIERNQKKIDRKQKVDSAIAKGAEVALDIAGDALKRGLEYLKDEKVQKQIISAGIMIAGKVIKSKL